MHRVHPTLSTVLYVYAYHIGQRRRWENVDHTPDIRHPTHTHTVTVTVTQTQTPHLTSIAPPQTHIHTLAWCPAYSDAATSLHGHAETTRHRDAETPRHRDDGTEAWTYGGQPVGQSARQAISESRSMTIRQCACMPETDSVQYHRKTILGRKSRTIVPCM
jgi:hypothetical protein